MKGVQPRKTLDFIGFSVFASGGAKMYPGFRTVEVFDSPLCSDIPVSEIPCPRTPGFQETLKFGQRRWRRLSRRNTPFIGQAVH